MLSYAIYCIDAGSRWRATSCRAELGWLVFWRRYTLHLLAGLCGR